MILTSKKGKDFWKSLYWARDMATEEIIEVMRGCILGLVETGKYSSLSYQLQINHAVVHMSDAYYQGRKWQYDFDAKILIAPGNRYYIEPRQSKVNENAFDFLAGVYSPFREVPGRGVNWSEAVQSVICDRDMASAMFDVAEQRIMQSSTITYPSHYRKLKKHIDAVEAAM